MFDQNSISGAFFAWVPSWIGKKQTSVLGYMEQPQCQIQMLTGWPGSFLSDLTYRETDSRLGWKDHATLRVFIPKVLLVMFLQLVPWACLLLQLLKWFHLQVCVFVMFSAGSITSHLLPVVSGPPYWGFTQLHVQTGNSTHLLKKQHGTSRKFKLFVKFPCRSGPQCSKKTWII